MAGTAIAAAASVLSAPLIYRQLGADAYGLVGFYLLLQGLLPLFDAGITAGFARAAAWHHGRNGLGQVRSLLRIARLPVAIAALLLLFGFIAGARLIATQWLGQTALGNPAMTLSLGLMGVALALRMPMLLDRAALGALERQVEVNIVQACAAVARTVGALAFAVVTRSGVIGFFAVQPVVSLVELVAYRLALRRVLVLPAARIGRGELASHVRFSLGLAALSALWLASSQLDRLVLSGVMSLDQYGAYSLGVHLASAVSLGVGAFQGAVLPRLTRLIAAGDVDAAHDLYGLSTAASVALGMTVLVGLVTGGALLIPSVRPQAPATDPVDIAVIYAAGNVVAMLMAQAYQLQNAYGTLRLHSVVAVSQAVVQAPLLAWAASTGSARLAAMVYMLVNVTLAAVWLPVVHGRFLPGRGTRWWLRDCMPPLVTGAICASVSLAIAQRGAAGVMGALAIVAATASITLASTVLVHPGLRAQVTKGWRHV